MSVSNKKVLIKKKNATSVQDLDTFLSNMNLAFGEPAIVSKNNYNRLYIGDYNGQKILVGPYLAGDGITLNDGVISMTYPITTLGTAGQVLSIDSDGDSMEWRTLIGIEHGTTAYWATRTDYIPAAGTICIYDDAYTKDNVSYPRIKIGSGNSYIADLAFTDKYLEDLINDHINDSVKHITAAERSTWNNKIHLSSNDTVTSETLQLQITTN